MLHVVLHGPTVSPITLICISSCSFKECYKIGYRDAVNSSGICSSKGLWKSVSYFNHHNIKYTQVYGMTVGLSFVIKLSNSVKDCLTPSVFFYFGCYYLTSGSGMHRKFQIK
jgi:hypothetical protein